jgi:hypothetical protein
VRVCVCSELGACTKRLLHPQQGKAQFACHCPLRRRKLAFAFPSSSSFFTPLCVAVYKSLRVAAELVLLESMEYTDQIGIMFFKVLLLRIGATKRGGLAVRAQSRLDPLL